jgi:hypothetical protein
MRRRWVSGRCSSMFYEAKGHAPMLRGFVLPKSCSSLECVRSDEQFDTIV